jgi:hypothetical protein
MLNQRNIVELRLITTKVMPLQVELAIEARKVKEIHDIFDLWKWDNVYRMLFLILPSTCKGINLLDKA